MQRTPDWFERRRGKATASRAAEIASQSASYVTQLVMERVTGIVEQGYQSKAMEDGILREADNKAAYEFATGHTVTDVDFVDHPTIPMLGCSPDGYVGKAGLMEAKCPTRLVHWETLLGKRIQTKYQWQMKLQLLVTGRKWCDFTSYNPDFPLEQRIVIIRFEPSKPELGALEAMCKSFLTIVDAETKTAHAILKGALK